MCVCVCVCVSIYTHIYKISDKQNTQINYTTECFHIFASPRDHIWLDTKQLLCPPPHRKKENTKYD